MSGGVRAWWEALFVGVGHSGSDMECSEMNDQPSCVSQLYKCHQECQMISSGSAF